MTAVDAIEMLPYMPRQYVASERLVLVLVSHDPTLTPAEIGRLCGGMSARWVEKALARLVKLGCLRRIDTT